MQNQTIINDCISYDEEINYGDDGNNIKMNNELANNLGYQLTRIISSLSLPFHFQNKLDD